MTVTEIEKAIQQLSGEDFSSLMFWTTSAGNSGTCW